MTYEKEKELIKTLFVDILGIDESEINKLVDKATTKLDISKSTCLSNCDNTEVGPLVHTKGIAIEDLPNDTLMEETSQISDDVTLLDEGIYLLDIYANEAPITKTTIIQFTQPCHENNKINIGITPKQLLSVLFDYLGTNEEDQMVVSKILNI